MCAVAGSWGGQRPSLAGYVAGTGAHGRGARRRRVLMLPTLAPGEFRNRLAGLG